MHFVFIVCCITAVACIFFIFVLRLAVQAIVLIKLELSWVELIHGSLSCHEFNSQTASRSIQPFLHSSSRFWSTCIHTDGHRHP